MEPDTAGTPFSLIYIIGTGLSVTMVMVLSIIIYLKVAPVYPRRTEAVHWWRSEPVVKLKEKAAVRDNSLHMLQSTFGDLAKRHGGIGDNLRRLRLRLFIQPENSKEDMPVTAGC